MSIPSYRVASIPGDGIGPEVVEAAIEVVTRLAAVLRTFEIEFTRLPWGSDYWKKTGSYVPADYLEVYRQFDACLFGSVGAPGGSRLYLMFLPTSSCI
jgi:isocitrate/isopropylmalate dehydrogenase